MKISLIVAMASNRVIGLNNKMPWHLSADLKKFKKITMGSPIQQKPRLSTRRLPGF
jgi:dihydrofolate reductase